MIEVNSFKRDLASVPSFGSQMNQLFKDIMKPQTEATSLFDLRKQVFLMALRGIRNKAGQNSNPNGSIQASCVELSKEIESTVKLTPEGLQSFRERIKELLRQVGGVSKEEMQLVVQAMAKEGGSGHWYKCPNVSDTSFHFIIHFQMIYYNMCSS